MFGFSISVNDLQRSDPLLLAEAAGQFIIDTQLDAPDGAIGDRLEAGCDFRFVVHQAAGMIAAQLGIRLQDALIRLRAHAFVNASSISDIAADVVARRLRSDNSDEC